MIPDILNTMVIMPKEFGEQKYQESIKNLPADGETL